MTDREIEIMDAVGEYVDRKFGDKAYSGESYTEEVQDYFDELVYRVDDAYSNTDCNNCSYDVAYIDQENGDLVMMGHYCSNGYVNPYTLASIKDVVKEMHKDEMKIRTLKNALGL